MSSRSSSLPRLTSNPSALRVLVPLASEPPWRRVEVSALAVAGALAHYQRRSDGDGENEGNLIGTLLGTVDDETLSVRVTRAFAVPHTEGDAVSLNLDVHRTLARLYAAASPRERVVGWFHCSRHQSTSSSSVAVGVVRDSFALLHEFYWREADAWAEGYGAGMSEDGSRAGGFGTGSPSPLLLLIDVGRLSQPQASGRSELDPPIQVLYSAPATLGDRGVLQHHFRRLPHAMVDLAPLALHTENEPLSGPQAEAASLKSSLTELSGLVSRLQDALPLAPSQTQHSPEVDSALRDVLRSLSALAASSAVSTAAPAPALSPASEDALLVAYLAALTDAHLRLAEAAQNQQVPVTAGVDGQ